MLTCTLYTGQLLLLVLLIPLWTWANKPRDLLLTNFLQISWNILNKYTNILNSDISSPGNVVCARQVNCHISENVLPDIAILFLLQWLSWGLSSLFVSLQHENYPKHMERICYTCRACQATAMTWTGPTIERQPEK